MESDAASRRILVCAPPKSGSTYMANVCGRYLDVDLSLPSALNFVGNHNLTTALGEELSGRRFCFNFHMLPHVLNLLMAQHLGVGLLVVWRNLGDMFVSMDDHTRRESENGPAFYIADLESYHAMPPEQRQLVHVDQMLPWYVRFYLMWRAGGATLHPYEQMLLEPAEFFSRILEPLAAPVQRERVVASLEGLPGGNRLNVGRAGRSADQLSDAAKREIEARLLRHPDWQQLEILLWELPWSVPALAPVHALDGSVVTAAGGDGSAFFVSRGWRYPISRSSWLGTRVGERRVPKPVEPSVLERLPVGAPLL